MDFHTATDALKDAGISLREQAKALGVEYQTLAQMRMKPGASGYRSPPAPDVWRAALRDLARERSEQLAGLAERLDS
ncbi:MAG: hypothetical protein H0W11_02860 [Gemmatimonadetes bacterium]|jgi:hypothetical protein|nr:hypothetical protein [Gemmatimonadota bacterium]